MTAGRRGIIRLCARIADWSDDGVPLAECAVPERCEHDRTCTACGQLVHYDPKASVPQLGAEVIVCRPCMDRALERGLMREQGGRRW